MKRGDRSKLLPNGSTLIEVLISLVIFSVGALGLAKFQGFILQTSSLAKQQTEALLQASSIIESLKLTPLSKINSTGTQKTEGTNTVFTTRWQQSSKESGGTVFDATISWPDRNNVDKNNQPQASQQTTLQFKSIIPVQSYVDDSLRFKLAKTSYISLKQVDDLDINSKD